MGELIIMILAGAFLFYVSKRVGDKRAQITHRCPNCGTICHASRWGTGMRHRDGSYVHSFKCPNCGNSFYD
jgi:predicted RNA-binding Zn-ribbon protein involved in translation (DUF1610 family)